MLSLTRRHSFRNSDSANLKKPRTGRQAAAKVRWWIGSQKNRTPFPVCDEHWPRSCLADSTVHKVVQVRPMFLALTDGIGVTTEFFTRFLRRLH
jgi:hypothetical protein